MHNPALKVCLELARDRFSLNVDFETTQCVTGIFGVSGSGKTSLLEAVAGLLPHVQGSIRMGDAVWLESSRSLCKRPEERRIGYVPQDILLFPNKNVRENLLAGASRAKSQGVEVDALFDQVVQLLEIKHLLRSPIATLSGGEAQRVALGRAICSGPELLLLDEPLASIDLGLRRKIIPFLEDVRDQFNLPMLLVSHDPLEIQALCDDLIVLDKGKVLSCGKPREVLTQAQIFPAANHRGYENLLPCRIAHHAAENTMVNLGSKETGQPLVVPRAASQPGAKIWVSIPARDIILATNKPGGISARNVLPAEIRSLKTVGKSMLALTSVAEVVPEIAVEITEQACRELQLEVGKPIFLIFKRSTCTVLEA